MIIQSAKLNWKGVLLWSNQFYGICAVLLSVESTLFIKHVYPSFTSLLLIHLSTVLFYTHSYLKEYKEGIYNERTNWYQSNKRYLQLRQLGFSLLCLYLALFKLNALSLLNNASLLVKAVALFALILSITYYIPFNLFTRLKPFRKVGIFKSIGIALVWSIVCCFIPVWLTNPNVIDEMNFDSIFWVHFFQIFAYILILAVLFDIKDLNRDKEEFVNTIVVKYGTYQTINKIIPPLYAIYFLLILLEFKINSLSYVYWVLQLSLVGLTYIISQKVVKQQSIHANILMIDGLMIIKAILSILVLNMVIH